MNNHRGTDPEAIKVADNLGLAFDGMQACFTEKWPLLYGMCRVPKTHYQFTIAPGQPGEGITYYVREVSQAESRRDEKLRR